jgi:hypothetical protein
MSLSYWNVLCCKVSSIIPRSAKRRTPSRRAWVLGAEHLEQRALLSAVMHHGAPADAAEVVTAKQGQDDTYPNLAGTWNLSGSNGTVFTGSVTFQQVDSEHFEGTVTVPNVTPTPISVERTKNKVEVQTSPPQGDNLDAHGTINKQHDTATFHTTTEDENGKRQRLTTVVKFNSSSNPTSFTITVTGKKKAVLGTVVGTKVVP